MDKNIIKIKEYVEKGIQFYQDKLDKEQPKGAAKTSINGSIQALSNMLKYLEDEFQSNIEIKNIENKSFIDIEGVMSLLEYSKYNNIKDIYNRMLNSTVSLYIIKDKECLYVKDINVNIKGQMLFLKCFEVDDSLLPTNVEYYIHLKMINDKPALVISKDKNESQIKITKSKKVG